MSEQLEKCPCCDAAAKLKNGLNEKEAYAICEKCGLRTDFYKCVSLKDSRVQAVMAWNKRADRDEIMSKCKSGSHDRVYYGTLGEGKGYPAVASSVDADILKINKSFG